MNVIMLLVAAFFVLVLVHDCSHNISAQCASAKGLPAIQEIDELLALLYKFGIASHPLFL